jgi:hypothetical protein
MSNEVAVKQTQIKQTVFLGDKLFAIDDHGDYWVSGVEFIPLRGVEPAFAMFKAEADHGNEFAKAIPRAQH